MKITREIIAPPIIIKSFAVTENDFCILITPIILFGLISSFINSKLISF